MKNSHLQDLRNKPLPELEKIARDGREKIRTLKFDLAAGKVKNVRELKSARRETARVLTIIRENLKTKNG